MNTTSLTSLRIFGFLPRRGNSGISFPTSARCLVVAAVLVYGCSSDEQPTRTRAPRNEWLGTVQQTIGDEKSETSTFGDIDAIDIDSAGNIAVVDRKRRDVRIFSADGRYRYTVGRSGSGPGEFKSPCCATFDRQGRLWVPDPILRRASVFFLSDTAAKHMETRKVGEVPGKSSTMGDVGRLVFLGDSVIGVGVLTRSDANQKSIGPDLAWTYWTPDGSVGRQVPIPNKPQSKEQTGMVMTKVNVGGRAAQLGLALPHPLAARWLFTQADDGRWAVTNSDSYLVELYGRDGKLIARIERQEVPNPPTSADLAWGDSLLAADLTRTKVNPISVKVPPPERLPAIVGLFFDREGRLWVQKGIHRGGPSIADIYNADGTYAGNAQWPQGIDLTRGLVRGNTAYGVAEPGDGAGPRIVRLKFENKQ
jgi:hypothetical protein